MKQCCSCKQRLDTTNYYRDCSSKDGLSKRCKDCQKSLSKLHYLVNKDSYKDTRTRGRELRRQIMKDAKSVPCADCEVQYPYWIMQFDHLKDKEFQIGTHGYRVGIEKLKNEISKCEVVCANCHSHRTYIRSIRGQ